MKRVIFFMLVTSVFASCQPEPQSLIFKWKTRTSLGGLLVEYCCMGSGKECAKLGDYDAIRSSSPLATYLNANNVAGFFKDQPWQNYFPELVGHEDIVQQIIALNPKVIFLNEKAFAFLKDSTKPYSEENHLFGFINRYDNPCEGF
jgi:hypothetical protein